MTQIIVPWVLPGLVAVAIYTILTAWDDYLMVLAIAAEANAVIDKRLVK